MRHLSTITHFVKSRCTKELTAFKEVRRRTNVVGRFPGEKAALAMVFGVLEEERLKWQGVGMKADDIAWIEEAVKALEVQPMEIEGLLVPVGSGA